MTNQINDILRFASQALIASSNTPRLDAEVLLMHVLGFSRAQLLTRSNTVLSGEQLKLFNELIAQRKMGKPIAYLLGYREFWSLQFKVTPDTLIPRPETELLIELALQKFPGNKTIKVADLGTGSGAIALAIAHERPSWLITATDYSAAALVVARANALQLQLNNVEFVQGEWCKALGQARFHIIISNPPYVRADDEHLQQGDVRFEPVTALVSGRDGLQDIYVIVKEAWEYLLPDGWLMVEHGYDQAAAVRELLQAQGYSGVTQHLDLAGIERVTVGRR